MYYVCEVIGFRLKRKLEIYYETEVILNDEQNE